MAQGTLEPAIAELLRDYPVVVTTMVAWADMDANEHVNHGAFFRYIEHARLKYFHELRLLRMQRDDGIGPILAWIDCRFRASLSYPDTVSIGARIAEMGADRFMMHSIIVSHEKRLVVGESEARTITFDYQTNQKVPLPEDVRRKIDEIQGRS